MIGICFKTQCTQYLGKGVFTCSILASIVTILVSIVVILMSIEPILEKCGHLQVEYPQVLSEYFYLSFEAILKRFSARINFKSQFQSNDLPQALK